MKSQRSTNIMLYCEKTVTSKKLDVNWKEGIKKTTYHPTFGLKVEFGDSKYKRTSICPHCKKQIGYKAFRSEFSLKKALKWAGLIIVVSVIPFSLGLFLYVFGGWELDAALTYFSIWGLFGFIFGMGLLIFQVIRYFTSYSKKKYNTISY